MLLVEAGAKALRPNPDMDKAFAGLLVAFGAFSEARPTVSEDEELRFHVDAFWVASQIYSNFRGAKLRVRSEARELLERALGVCERALAADPSAVAAWSFGLPAPLRSVLARGLYDLHAWAPDDEEERFLARSLVCFGDERLLELPGELKPLARATVELGLLKRTLASAAPEQLAADMCRLLKDLASLKVGRRSEAPILGHEIHSVIGLGCRLLERDVSAVRQVVRCIREFEATTTRRFEGDTSFELESLELAVAVIDGDIELAKARVEGVLGRLKHGSPIRGMELPLTVAARVLRNDQAKATLFEKHGILARVKRAAFLTQAEWIRQFNGWSPYLNDFAWTTVSQADQALEHYTIALGWAEEAARHDPDNAQILNTLGVAQYRVGAYDKALATLTRSDELDRRPDASHNGPSTSAPASQPVRSGAADLGHPANAAFIAMAQFKLGRIDEAKASLARLRDLMRDTGHAANQEYRAFLAEAADLIEASAPLPGNAPATQGTRPN